jgi:hypothetical protein
MPLRHQHFIHSRCWSGNGTSAGVWLQAQPMRKLRAQAIEISGHNYLAQFLRNGRQEMERA